MKKILFACLCLIGVTAIAQKKETEKTPAAPILANTLLWEVSGNGLTQPSYIFGTMHLLCANDARLSDSLTRVITQVNQVYFEIDMDNMAEMMGMLRYIRMGDNKKLSDLLSVTDYEKVKKHFKEHPAMLPLSMMETFKPFFITALMEQQQMPCEKMDGMESVIMEAAKKNKKEIKGLESIQFQASVFDSIPYDVQAKELVKFIDSAGKKNESTAELMKVYKAQDLAKIEKMTTQEEGGVGSSLDLLLYKRNANWATSIDSISKTKSCLYAVGAAHLPGNKGLINLLVKKGYRLRPMLHEVPSGALAKRE
jgi:uncharacterized protein